MLAVIIYLARTPPFFWEQLPLSWAGGGRCSGFPSILFANCNPGHKGEHVTQSRLSLGPCKFQEGILSENEMKLGSSEPADDRSQGGRQAPAQEKQRWRQRGTGAFRAQGLGGPEAQLNFGHT